MYPNWINSTLLKEFRLNEKYLKIGFSQNGEDEVIRSFFWDDILNNIKRTDLDIGCFHESLTPTQTLNLAGWNGIAVDANPEMEKQWTNRRQNDSFYNFAIKPSNYDEENQSLKFYRFETGAINTLSKSIAKEWISRGYNLKDIIYVESKSIIEIGKLIISNNPSFRPAFLNIDIEQVDYLDDLPEFLKTMNNPTLLCIEWVSQGFGIGNYKESKEFEVLSDCGYQISNIVGGNLFAVQSN